MSRRSGPWIICLFIYFSRVGGKEVLIFEPLTSAMKIIIPNQSGLHELVVTNKLGTIVIFQNFVPFIFLKNFEVSLFQDPKASTHYCCQKSCA